MATKLKECEICLTNAMCLCDKCMTYFCDSFFNIVHKNERRKSHKKEKKDYFILMDMKCPEII